MKKMTDDFTNQLKAAFRLEAHEQVQSLLDSLVKLEGASGDEQDEIIERCFRELHNLKGSARAVNFSSVEALCHPMEDVLSALKKGRMEPTSDMLDILLEGVCLIQNIIDIEDEQNHPNSEIHEVQKKLATLVGKDDAANHQDDEQDDAAAEIRSIALMPEPQKEMPMTAEAKASSVKATAEPVSESNTTTRNDHLRIPAVKLESFMQKAEEMLSIKAVARESTLAVNALQSNVESHSKNWAKFAPEVKRVKNLTEKLKLYGASPQEQSILKKLLELLETNSEFLQSLQTETKALARSAHDHSHSTATAVDILLDETKRLLMMPCSSLFEGFPLLVRQLSRELGKEVDFSMIGAEIEVDKRILSALKDPLVHILRNSVDHGIELPEARLAAGKSRRAKLEISVGLLDGSMVEMTVRDNGKGIDVEKVKQTAISLGIIGHDEAQQLTHDEALMLIFRSSLSTSPIITEISGRGIGLAIVDEIIRKLGGRIKVESSVGAGTTFKIVLPLTIATFRGVLVDVAAKTFAIPTTSIDRVVRVKSEEIKPVEGHDTILLGNSLVPLCRMDEALELPGLPEEHEDKLLTVSILGSGDSRMGFIVDEVLEEQEVLVKSLGSVLANVRNVSGVTILGSGKVVPILNVSDLLQMRKRSLTSKARSTAQSTATTKESRSRRRTILVVDDTLTARILLRNIFESASFDVKTANDGAEALSLLKREKFDALVTDIEMPRMNGFELTEKVRADQGLSDLPVVMVTSMTSREDRERGVMAGANAYFVKSSFDESNLLEVVNSLV